MLPRTRFQALGEAGYARPLRVLGRASGEFQRLNQALPLTQRRRLAQRVDLVVRAEEHAQ